MKRNTFNQIANSEKIAIFNAVAAEKGISAFAVEKDWWVSRTLEIIFQMDIAPYLVFKGGTSLSKAWKKIHRFSEDIDLALDRSFFEGFQGELTRSQILKLRKEAGIYTTETFFKEVKDAFIAYGFEGLQFKVIEAKDSDQDPRILEIYYPNIVSTYSKYIMPRIQIDVSCRSLKEPFSMCTIGSFVDEHFERKAFTSPLFEVPSVHPERTFLEKLFLLHEEFYRTRDKIRVDRLSRHLYDIYCLSKSDVVSIAFKNQELYTTIVAHRHRYARVGGVDYNLHNPKFLNPVPMDFLMDAWRADYKLMCDEMIYELDKPSFDDLIENLNQIKISLRKLPWEFDLKF
jgi:predicted nucleotidyltransferase component of viral defense system